MSILTVLLQDIFQKKGCSFQIFFVYLYCRTTVLIDKDRSYGNSIRRTGLYQQGFELRSDWIAMTAIVSAEEALAIIKRLYEGDNRLDFVAMRCELEQ